MVSALVQATAATANGAFTAVAATAAALQLTRRGCGAPRTAATASASRPRTLTTTTATRAEAAAATTTTVSPIGQHLRQRRRLLLLQMRRRTLQTTPAAAAVAATRPQLQQRHPSTMVSTYHSCLRRGNGNGAHYATIRPLATVTYTTRRAETAVTRATTTISRSRRLPSQQHSSSEATKPKEGQSQPAPPLAATPTATAAAVPRNVEAEAADTAGLDQQPAPRAEEKKKTPPSSSSSSSSKPGLISSVFNFVQREAQYAKEHYKKYQRPVPAKERRKIQDYKDLLEKRAAAEKAAKAETEAAAAAGEKKLSTEEGAAMAQQRMDDEGNDGTAPALAAAAAENAHEDGENMSVMFVDKSTKWDKRFSALRESLRSSSPFLKARKLTRETAKSDNIVIKQALEFKEDWRDAVEDVKETYETSQHPVVWKVRDASDAVFGETETGWAMGELHRLDPSFDVDEFLEDLEEYMIPIVVEAYLSADSAVLSKVCEGQAKFAIFQSTRSRQTLGHYWDTRILDIRGVELRNAKVIDGEPNLEVSFVCQHVKCVRNAKGEIVEGHEGDIRTTFYFWVLRRDFESDLFDWKLKEFGTQEIQMIA